MVRSPGTRRDEEAVGLTGAVAQVAGGSAALKPPAQIRSRFAALTRQTKTGGMLRNPSGASIGPWRLLG
jgi:hypothetical protein